MAKSKKATAKTPKKATKRKPTTKKPTTKKPTAKKSTTKTSKRSKAKTPRTRPPRRKTSKRTHAGPRADALQERAAPISRTLSFDKLLTYAALTTKRLLIRGVAGSGKTTLLRWAAVVSARGNDRETYASVPDASVTAIMRWRKGVRRTNKHKGQFHYHYDVDVEEAYSWLGDVGKLGLNIETKAIPITHEGDWHNRVPLFVRLRDYPDGKFPRPEEIVRSMSRALPDAPPGWIDGVLGGGRGLVMLDGVDEIPRGVRGRLKHYLRDLVAVYPNNLYVVTTRPGAVIEAWLADLEFLTADVAPMSPADRDEMVRRWHRALEDRLRSAPPRNNPPRSPAEDEANLLAILDNEPSVARLAIWPLLCAVICALHRAQRGNLPKSRVELCEKLCEMLLDRRDTEQPELTQQQHVAKAYGDLTYTQRKGMLSRLAKFMVDRDVSFITFDDAEAEIAAERDVGPDTARVLREAAIERSGLLRLAGDERIDFLHNTLKEYLAAERFVNAGDIDVLADHAGEAAWQPVVLFAATLPRPGSSFSENLLSAIVERLAGRRRRGRGKSSAKGSAATPQSPQAVTFLLTQCRAAVASMPRELAKQNDALTKNLFPPADFAAAEALAECGEEIVPYLRRRKEWTNEQRAACVRALRRVGGYDAQSRAMEYTADDSPSVTRELVLASDEREWALELTGNVEELNLSGTQVSDVSSLSALTGLESLDLRGTQVSDVSSLSGLTALRRLILMDTPLSDVSSLSGLTGLEYLDLDGTQVSDVSSLSALTGLQQLYLRGTQVSDVSSLDGIKGLRIWK